MMYVNLEWAKQLIQVRYGCFPAMFSSLYVVVLSMTKFYFLNLAMSSPQDYNVYVNKVMAVFIQNNVENILEHFAFSTIKGT